MATSWNPATLQTANGALSGGNLTYTKSANGDRAMRSLHTVPPRGYAEILLNGSDDTLGLLNGTPTLPATVDFFPGIDNNGVCAVSDGRILLNSVALVATGGLGTQAVGQRICIAWVWESGNGLFWARIQNGNWNGSGTANPATLTGGISITALGTPGTTPLYLSTTTYISGGGTTLKSGAAEWAFAPPAGFSEVNEDQIGRTTLPFENDYDLAPIFFPPLWADQESLTDTTFDVVTSVNGTLAQTLGAAASAATGTVPISATLAQTLGAATSAATGTVPVSATLAQTLASATLAGTGTVGNSVNGVLNQGLGAVTAVGTGTLLVAGSLAGTLGAVTGALTGAARVSGTVTQSLADATLAAAGTVPPLFVSGALNATLADVSLFAAGTAAFGWSDAGAAPGSWSDVSSATGLWSDVTPASGLWS